jgi:Ca2+/Na+ antiporter
MIGDVLYSNAERVRNLTPTEVWLFIVARVLVGFGAGALLVRYFPQIIGPIALPVLVIGLILFAVAARGLSRTRSN